MPTWDELVPEPQQRYRFSLEPAHNNLSSLVLLNQVEQLSGLDPWVAATAERLTPEQRHRNRLVLEGLHYAVLPAGPYPSFWAYMDALGSADPFKLRNRLLELLWGGRHAEAGPGTLPLPDGPQGLVASLNAYMGFLEHHFKGKFDPELEAEAYSYLVDPQRMQNLIVGHLRTLWSEHLAAEWERVRGRLQETLGTFSQLNLSDKGPLDAFTTVVGHAPDEKLGCKLQEHTALIFVPSAHLGPYVSKMGDGQTLRVFFGARLPAGIAGGAELSRADLLVRLTALADDTRLRVLALLAHEDELCAPELMARLDLHQSAVSRHLRQLVATGYVSERWRDGSKCYRLSRDRLGDTLRALERYLN